MNHLAPHETSRRSVTSIAPPSSTVKHNRSHTGRVRVCHVAVGDLWAGAEVQLAALVHDLVKRPGLEISAVLLNQGRLFGELQKAGIEVTVFPEADWTATTIFRYLFRYLRSYSIDLIHTHKYKDNILGTMAAKLVGIPYVVRTVHGLSEPFVGREAWHMRAYEWCDDLATRMAVDKVIAVSSQIHQVLSLKFRAHKVVQIHNGIRVKQTQATRKRSEIREKLGVDPKSQVIGTVGRLTPVKGHEHLIYAAQQLLKIRRDVQVMIVGNGPLMNSLRGLVEHLEITEKVVFLGHRDDVYDLICAMDIFVLPSLHEGIPMVILEAMALARPVVASRVGGIPEVINDHVEGLLVTAGNPSELAYACHKLIDDQDLRIRLGAAGQQRVEAEFSSDAMGAKVAALYRELVGN